MKQFIFYFFMMAYSIACAAQTPKPTIHSLTGIGSVGSDAVMPDVVTTPDGGFIVKYTIYTSVAGSSPLDSLCNVTTGLRIIFAKYNADASVLEWTTCSATTNVDSFVYHIETLPNGDSVVFEEHTGKTVAISKYDASGNLLWKQYHGAINGIGNFYRGTPRITLDGGYIVLGMTQYADTNFTFHYGGWQDGDFTVYKIDSLGNKQWSKVFGGSGNDIPVGIFNSDNGGWLIIGRSNSGDYDAVGNKGGYDAYIAKIDDTGKLLWHKNIGGSEPDGIFGAISNKKNGVYLAGTTYSKDGDVQHHKSSGYKANMWLMEVDNFGQLLWENCYGGGGREAASTVSEATDGSLWIAGISEESGGQVDTNYGDGDAFIVNTDNVGNLLSALVLGSSSTWTDDVGQMLHPLPQGKVLLGGRYGVNDKSFSSLSINGAHDVYLAKLSPNATNIFENTPQHFQTPFKAYPNPAKDILQIEVFDTKEYTLTIHDNTGKKVVEQKTKGNKSINISDWAAGIYYIQYSNSIKEMYQQKIIIR